jgi:putative resolvase
MRRVSDPYATVVVVKHRARLARFRAEHLQEMLAASGWRIAVDEGEISDGVARNLADRFPTRCATLHGRRGVRNGVTRTVTATKRPGLVEATG